MNVNKIASILREEYLQDNSAAGMAAYESPPTGKRYKQYEDLNELTIETEEK